MTNIFLCINDLLAQAPAMGNQPTKEEEKEQAENTKFTAGTRVMAKWHGGTRAWPGWYPAVVVKRNQDNTLHVRYNTLYSCHPDGNTCKEDYSVKQVFVRELDKERAVHVCTSFRVEPAASTMQPLPSVPTVQPLPFPPTMQPLPSAPIIHSAVAVSLPSAPTVQPLPSAPIIHSAVAVSLPSVPTVQPLPSAPIIHSAVAVSLPSDPYVPPSRYNGPPPPPHPSRNNGPPPPLHPSRNNEPTEHQEQQRAPQRAPSRPARILTRKAKAFLELIYGRNLTYSIDVEGIGYDNKTEDDPHDIVLKIIGTDPEPYINYKGICIIIGTKNCTVSKSHWSDGTKIKFKTDALNTDAALTEELTFTFGKKDLLLESFSGKITTEEGSFGLKGSIINHVEQLTTQQKNRMQGKECPVCFEAFGANNVTKVMTPCGHFFCMECIAGSLGYDGNLQEGRCPICRSTLKLKDVLIA